MEKGGREWAWQPNGKACHGSNTRARRKEHKRSVLNVIYGCVSHFLKKNPPSQPFPFLKFLWLFVAVFFYFHCRSPSLIDFTTPPLSFLVSAFESQVVSLLHNKSPNSLLTHIQRGWLHLLWLGLFLFREKFNKPSLPDEAALSKRKNKICSSFHAHASLSLHPSFESLKISLSLSHIHSVGVCCLNGWVRIEFQSMFTRRLAP